MKQFFLIPLFFILYNYYCFGQQLTPNQERIIRGEISKQFNEVSTQLDLTLNAENTCIVGNDTLFNPDGYHYVFKLTKGSAIRLDKSIWHGGNFHRFLFEWNGTLYALGGYGFFTTNNNLEYYNQKTSDWGFEATNGEGPQHINGYTFKKGNYIYSTNNVNSGNNASPSVTDTSVYMLNLSTMTWDKLSQLTIGISGDPIYIKRIMLKDYFLLISKPSAYVIKPAELKYIIISSEKHGLHADLQTISTSGNVLTFSSSRARYQKQKDTIDCTKLWTTMEKDSKPLFVIHPELGSKKSSSNKTWIILALAILIVPTISYYFIRRFKPTRKSETTEIETTEYVIKSEAQWDADKAILECKKTTLSTDELDELLGITQLDQDNKKLKRHRILNDFEQKYPNIITRMKDQNDKRKYFYKLQQPRNNGSTH